jgi:CMP-N,N'-diacetyllegionaminic acid synthase
VKILALIPARGGSKGIRRKNLRRVGSRSLVEHAVRFARTHPRVDRVLVSTDDPEIRDVALSSGAEVPFLRPATLAEDTTPDRPVVRHALDHLLETEGYDPDLVVFLRPTAPLRAHADLDEALRVVCEQQPDGVRSVTRVEGVHHPYWMFHLDGRPVVPGVSLEQYPRRQSLPPAFRLNGVLDLLRPSVVRGDGPLYGERMALFEVPEERAHDIDTPADLALVRALAEPASRLRP